MAWEFSSGSPIWQQISERITLDAVTGHYAPGERIPSVRELAAEAGVNPNTMQRALAELESSGILVTNRTAGRTVTEDLAVLSTAREALACRYAREFISSTGALGLSLEDAIELIRRCMNS